MRESDVVVTSRYSDGAPFLGRLRDGGCGLWRVIDARGVVWWRSESETARVAGGDPRLAAFLSAEACELRKREASR